MTRSDVLTTLAIVVVVLVLAGLRALFWVRRVRLMTEVGRSLHHPDRPKGGSQDDGSG